MKYTDAHTGWVFTAKTPELQSHLALSGTNDEIVRDFHLFETEGNSLHDSLQFAESFLLTRNKLFTTYEEIWVYPEDMDEFENLLRTHLGTLAPIDEKSFSDLKAIQKLVKIAQNNKQDLIFYT